jgi:hypothetical protein
MVKGWLENEGVSRTNLPFLSVREKFEFPEILTRASATIPKSDATTPLMTDMFFFLEDNAGIGMIKEIAMITKAILSKIVQTPVFFINSLLVEIF